MKVELSFAGYSPARKGPGYFLRGDLTYEIVHHAKRVRTATAPKMATCEPNPLETGQKDELDVLKFIDPEGFSTTRNDST